MTDLPTEEAVAAAAAEALRKGLQTLRQVAREGARAERLYGASSRRNAELVRAGQNLLADLRELAEAEGWTEAQFQAAYEATGRRLS